MLTLRVRYRLALATCLVAGSLAAAQSPTRPESGSLCPPCLHDEVLKGLPLNIEAVVAVNGGAKQRSSAAGRALTQMIQSSGAMAETVQAWQELATTLGWTPERTFDEVLGRRVSLVIRGLNIDAAEGPDWALMSEVSTDTQRHLRNKLKAAPRGAIAGMSVLSIEDGSFEFVVSPEVRAGGRGAIILLAPRRSENMLDELAPALNIIPAAPDSPSRKACDVVVVWHKNGGATEPAQSLTLAASAMEFGWDATVVCSPHLILNGAAKPRRWTDSAFKSLETGSLMAVMSSTGAGKAIEPLAFVPPTIRSWVDELSAVVGSGESGLRVAAFVRAVGPNPSRPAQTVSVAGERSIPKRDETPAFHGRLAVTVAAETADPRAALVKGDRAIAQFAKVLMTGHAQESLAGVQLEIADRGPRSLRLGEALTVHPDIEPSLTRAFGETPLLVWNTINTARVHAPGEGAGWWIASLSPTGTGDREGRALMAAETGQPKARLCIGMVRPAAIDRWVSAIEPEVLGPIPGASFVESCRWDVWVRDDGQVEGAVNLRMVTPAAAPAAVGK